jgi:hypothetical protein
VTARGDTYYDPKKGRVFVWDGEAYVPIPEKHRNKARFRVRFTEVEMARTELTIKLVTYNDGKEAQAAVVDAARDAARTLVTVAMMLQEKRSPEISMFTDDFFEGTNEIVVDTEERADV